MALTDPNLDAPTVPSPDLHWPLAETDPEVDAAIAAELHRQQTTLEMPASENLAPAAVMETQGSVLTNKYTEGYPGRRYYGRCEQVDVIEQLAIQRLKAPAGANPQRRSTHSTGRRGAANPRTTVPAGTTSETEWR